MLLFSPVPNPAARTHLVVTITMVCLGTVGLLNAYTVLGGTGTLLLLIMCHIAGPLLIDLFWHADEEAPDDILKTLGVVLTIVGLLISTDTSQTTFICFVATVALALWQANKLKNNYP